MRPPVGLLASRSRAYVTPQRPFGPHGLAHGGRARCTVGPQDRTRLFGVTEIVLDLQGTERRVELDAADGVPVNRPPQKQRQNECRS